jgi:rsbT co-antagonist protein RsbR
MNEHLPPEREGEQAEGEALRAQIAALTARVRSLEGALGRERERFDAFTSTLPGISWETWGRPDEAPVSYVSPSVEALTGYTAEEWQSRPAFWLELVHPEDRARVKREIEACFAGKDERGVQEYRWITRSGEVSWAHVRFCIVRDEAGEPVIWQAFTLDATAQKAAETERDKMHDELVRGQASLLAELSTPLIPISDEVVAMPLIGPVDRDRADRALDVLLRGLSASRARFAILDVTGVPSVDEEVVQALLRAAAATRLLGAEVLITGIRAEVAQAFCAHGEGLSTITTCATLKQGVARAMARSAKRKRVGAPSRAR